MISVPLVSLCLLLVYCAWLIHCFITSKDLPLPPGPRGSLLAGVKDSIPQSEPWRTYAAWSLQYNNPFISFRVYNRRVVVLNSVQAVQDLLGRRANIYSDRPVSWMYNVICDRGKAIFNISSLDDRHKQYRKLVRTGLGVRATREYWPILLLEVSKLIDGLVASPDRYEKHIRRNAAGVIMKVAFGYTVVEDDPFIQVAEETAKISGWATAPGRWLVDYFPIVRFLPDFFPGTGFKRQGKVWRDRLRYLSDVPHEWVKKQMATQNYTESFTSRLLRPEGKDGITPEQEDLIKWCAGGFYAGAGDTTVSALISFVLLMALNPDVQRRAQAEIDEIVGKDHLPHPDLLNQLVYLLAVMKEVLRYAPVGNLALPHRVIRDDDYDGYRIPKDATIMANVWAIMHDPYTYPKPFEFSPTRFLTSGHSNAQADPRQFSFGFGSRSCPGVHFAETTMLLTMASILSRFDISLPEKGPKPEVGFTTGITSHIKCFPIEIHPRQGL